MILVLYAFAKSIDCNHFLKMKIELHEKWHIKITLMID